MMKISKISQKEKRMVSLIQGMYINQIVKEKL